MPRPTPPAAACPSRPSPRPDRAPPSARRLVRAARGERRSGPARRARELVDEALDRRTRCCSARRRARSRSARPAARRGTNSTRKFGMSYGRSTRAVHARPGRAFGTPAAAKRAMIDGARERCFQATGMPVASGAPPCGRDTRPEEVVLDVFLARPDDLDRAVDLLRDPRRRRTTCPVSSRRPKPPPSRWLWTVTLLRGRPAVFAAAACARARTWVPTQTSQASA